MSWFSVRSVFKFGTKANGTNIFEERIVAFQAETFDEALEKAEQESEAYANENGFIAASEMEAYMQDGASLIDGYEVFSQLFESKATLEEFYQSRYVQYAYTPENHDK